MVSTELLLAATLGLSAGLGGYAWRRGREVARLQARNRELSQHIVAVQESERRAIARELHDEIAQACTAIRVEAACVQRATDPSQVVASAQRSAETAALLHDGVGRLLRRLRPAELESLGLVAALRALCQACEERGGATCRFVSVGAVGSLGEAVESAIYRVAQEALCNTVRHARATSVTVVLSCSATGLVLQVEDDGCGFDTRRRARGFGIVGAAERAAALGGTLGITSCLGAGTTVRLAIPRAT